MKRPFVKMHGLGNDFVVLEHSYWKDLDAAKAAHLCDRHLGVGADQILVLGPAPHSGADAEMTIWNPDGSRAEMCGNGIRAAALYLETRRDDASGSSASSSKEWRIQTLGGLKTVRNVGRQTYRVDMGVPRAASKVEPLADLGIEFFEVDMGNPHAVVFGDLSGAETLGRTIERHPRFPRRTNVEWVEVTGPQSAKVRVWERGAGLTLACGTGACAVTVALEVLGKVSVRGKPIQLALPGGVLEMQWAGGSSPVWMTGPAAWVFEGTIDG